MPPPRDFDFWPFDLEVGVGVACAKILRIDAFVDDDDSFCLTSLLISVMMSDSSHCQNRTIYKLAYIYGAVGSIVLLHAWLYTLLYTLYTLYTLSWFSVADKAVNVRWW